MRWIVFILLLCLILTVQSAVIPRLSLWGARADLLLATTVFLGLFARPRESIVAAWLLGVGADLLTIERFGLMSLTYVVIALSVSSIRLYVFRESRLTQLVVTLIAALLVNLFGLLYRHVVYDPGESVVRGLGGSVILASLYTTAMSMPLYAVLRRLGPALGLPRRHSAAVSF